MPLPRFDKLPPERKSQIIEAATLEFVEHGPAKASVNRILKAAELSKGAFYYYFHDKDDLWLAVMEHAMAPLWAAMHWSGDVDHPDDWWQQVEASTLSAVAVMAEHPAPVQLMRGAWHHPDSAVLARLLAPFEAIFAELLGAGQLIGSVRNDLPQDLLVSVSMAMGSAVDRWFADRWETLRPDEAIRLSLQSVGLFRDLLQPGPRPPTGSSVR